MQEELRVKEARLLVTVQLISIMVLALLVKLFELFPSDKYGRQITKSPINAKYFVTIVWFCFFGFLANQAMTGYKTLRSASIYENTYRIVEGLRSEITETDYYQIRGAMLQVRTEAQYFKVMQMLAKSAPHDNSNNK